MAHVHGALYRESGLLTLAGKENIEISPFGSYLVTQRVAIIHCKSHQKGRFPEARPKEKLTWQPKEGVLEPVRLCPSLGNPTRAQFTGLPGMYPMTEKQDWLQRMVDAARCRSFFPASLERLLVTHLHKATHLGATDTADPDTMLQIWKSD